MRAGDEKLKGFPQDVTNEVIAYLTGDLSGEARESFENRMLAEEFFSQQVEEIQFALLEAYAEGELPSETAQSLARWIASSETADLHVRITRSLRKIAAAPQSQVRKRVTFGAVAVAASLILGTGYVVQLHHHRAAPGLVAKLEPQVGRAVQPSSQNTILLVGERLRDASPSEPRNTYRIREDEPSRLQVVLPSSHRYDMYSVIVRRSADGMTVGRFSAIPVQRAGATPFVEVLLPAHTLSRGSYRIDVSAPLDSFALRMTIEEALP